MRFVLGALLTLILVGQAAAVDEVIETAPVFKIFLISSGADSTFKLVDFDFDGDGDLDMAQIWAIGWSNGSSGGPDTLWYHADGGWWPSAIRVPSDEVIPLRTKRFTEIRQRPHPVAAAVGDSLVFRYKAGGAGDVYLHVWGN